MFGEEIAQSFHRIRQHCPIARVGEMARADHRRRQRIGGPQADCCTTEWLSLVHHQDEPRLRRQHGPQARMTTRDPGTEDDLRIGTSQCGIGPHHAAHRTGQS